MVFPEPLKKGDLVSIVGASSPVSKEDAFACKAFLENEGYKVILNENTYEPVNDYQAGTAKSRIESIHNSFVNKDVKAIICIRGGISSCHIMGELDAELIKQNPKIFVGFSDVTNLHLFINKHVGLVTFHGPMVKSNMLNSFDGFTRESFYKAIEIKNELIFSNPPGVPLNVISPGIAEGQLVGGNLALIMTSIGTHYEIDTKNAILFIEDVGETPSKIDRMLYHLKYAGKLDDVNGIILGDFSDSYDQTYPDYSVEQLFTDFFKDMKIPVMSNIQSGHCRPMATLPLGAHCKMDTEKTTLTFSRQ